MILDARFSSERLGCERVHSHEYSVVAAVESGTIKMIIAGQLLKLAKGVVCVIPEGVSHRILSTSEDFSGVHVLSLDCAVIDSSGCKVLKGILANDQKWYLQFLKLMRDFDGADERKTKMLYESFSLFLGRKAMHLSDDLEKRRMASVHWVPAEIKNMMDRDAEMGTVFQYIEEHMPFSKEHCNRLFKKFYSTTIQGYGLVVRTEKARLLLKSGLPVAESAAEAGFYDQSQLTRVFKSIFQLTPAEYRKQAQKSRSV